MDTKKQIPGSGNSNTGVSAIAPGSKGMSFGDGVVAAKKMMITGMAEIILPFQGA